MNKQISNNHNFNPDYADELGENAGALAGVVFAPEVREKIYSAMTKVNVISASVATLAGTTALFIGGQSGVYIGIGVGVLTVVNTVANSFTNRLAKKNVS